MKITTHKQDIKITSKILSFAKNHFKQYDSVMENIEYEIIYVEESYTVLELLSSGIYELNEHAADVMSIYKL